MNPVFQYSQYQIKRQVFALTGKLRFYAPDGRLVLFAEQKMFRLREDIRLFSDEAKSQELLLIKARQIIDWAAAYDVLDGVREYQMERARIRPDDSFAAHDLSAAWLERIRGPFRMAVDRAFTIAGHGTVVTGSVSSGRARIGDELVVEPGAIEVRVRGLQNQGAAQDPARLVDLLDGQAGPLVPGLAQLGRPP